jgi:hypothetical protein
MIYKSNWVIAEILLAVLTLVSPAAVAQANNGKPTQNVLVVNDSGQPVPTAPQGTTNVAGTINVGNTPNVNVANTANVNVANMPSVSITGTPTVSLAAGGSVGVTNPLDGQSNPTPLAITEGAQVYEDTCSTVFAGQNFGNCYFHSLPAGKRLVIQEFDAGILVDPGVKPANLTMISMGAIHYFPATPMGNFNGDQFATHQATHLYTNAGGTPSCSATLSGFSSGSLDCSISGFLLDQP